MRNRKNPLHKGGILLFHLLLLVFILSIILSSTLALNDVYHNVDIWLGISSTGLLWYVFSYYRLTDRLLSPYVAFIVFSYFFHFGQVLMWRWGLVNDPYYFLMVSNYSPDVILQAMMYSVLTMALVHTGALIYLLFFNKLEKKIDNDFNDSTNLVAIRSTGYVLLAIAIVPLMIYDGSYFRAAIAYGYLEIYNLSINNGLWDDLSRLVKPAIVFLMIGYRNKRKVANLIFILAIGYSLLKMYLIGQRGYEMVFIISLIWIRHVNIAPIKGIKFIIYSCYIIIVLTLMSLIADTRGMSKANLTSFTEIISTVLEKNPIVQAVIEFGSTLTTPVVAMMNVPDNLPFGHGFTYIKSFFTLLPNINGSLTSLTKGVSPAVELSDYASALGGSYIAEFYYNFGWVGVLAGIVLGFIIARYSIKASYSNKLIVLISASTFLSILLWFIRDSFVYIPRAVLMYIVFPYIIWRLFSEFSRRKGN